MSGNQLPKGPSDVGLTGDFSEKLPEGSNDENSFENLEFRLCSVLSESFFNFILS